MSKSLEIFTALEKNGIKGLEILQKRAFAPGQRKTLRTWGPTDMSKMVGRSRKFISDLEKEGKLPNPPAHPDTGKKYYTLDHINQIREYFKTRPHKPQNARAFKIAITNFKGGVTKSSTSIHLAHGLALAGYKVLLVDKDSQATATQSFGYIPDRDIDDDKTLLPFYRDEISSLESIVQKTYWSGIDLIPANLALYNAEFELPVKQIRNANHFKFYELFKQGISTIDENYDVIIYDCPPSMGMLSINAIYAADALIIPVPPAMLDFCSTVQFFGMMRDVLCRLPAKDYNFVRLLITKYDKTDNSKALINVLRQLFGDYVLMSMMPISEAIKKAGTEMRSIYEIEEYAGSKKTLDRVRQAADEVNQELIDLIQKAWHPQAEEKMDAVKEAINV